jgi:hypothetical protein
MSAYQTTILFHGNCIDGWFSAYFAYHALRHNGEIQLFPIAPSQPNTWPSAETMEGTDVWLLDVSVPEHFREEWLEAGARSVSCIDHHATAIEQWPAHACPIHTDCCAALQTHQHFYPDTPIPEWLHSIDRIDRWVDVTYEDRCLREFLYVIARKPVQRQMPSAFQETDQFIHCMTNYPKTYDWYLSEGQKILTAKDASLKKILKEKGTFLTIDDELQVKWDLPQSWNGIRSFIMDNSDVALDTTEASHLIFTENTDVRVFINYRKKLFYTKGPSKVMKSMTVYSARSNGIDLTVGTVLRGHPSSAGASLVQGEASHFPFLL